MSFLEIVGDIGEAASELPRSLMGSLVSQGLSEGLSANAMLRGLTEAGAGIRRQSFLQLVGEVRNATARAGDLALAPVDSQLSEDQYAVWSGGRSETYLHRVSLFVRQTVEGVTEVSTRNFDILTEDRLSPSEAVQHAIDIFNANTGSERYPTEQLLGAELRGAYHQTGL